MIKIVVAYDDNDSLLGDYFEESYNNFSSKRCMPQVITQTIVLRGLDCDEASINSAVNTT
jgi:hypothetical protein